jgi:putative transposase
VYVAGGTLKKVIKPAARRTLVTDLEKSFRVSERRDCEVLCIGSTHRYRSLADYQAALRMRIKEIAAVLVRYGYKRIHVLLQREGWDVNPKQVYRVYCEEGLNLGRKRPRKRPSENLRVAR